MPVIRILPTSATWLSLSYTRISSRGGCHRLSLVLPRTLFCFMVAWLSSFMVEFSIVADTGFAASPQVQQDQIQVRRAAENGPHVLTFPLFHVGELKYFAAGVGLEEREASYPAFPLKLIFVAANKPFVSLVGVTFRNLQGETILDIPPDHVTGPWLFVDLPPGRYEVVARRQNGDTVTKTITVRQQGTARVYFHWPTL